MSTHNINYAFVEKYQYFYVQKGVYLRLLCGSALFASQPTLIIFILSNGTARLCRPRWLSWMRRLTGDQEVAGSTPAEVGNILSWRLIMKYFLWSFSPFR